MLISSRRSFVARLGLGAGAVLLAPIAKNLVRTANGEDTARKKILFFVHGEAMWLDTTMPPEAWTPEEERVELSADAVTWRPMYAPLEHMKSRMLLLDGLTNRVKEENHSWREHGFRCMQKDQPGPSIDQFLATTLSAGMPWRSIHGAMGGRPVFATGPGERVPTHFGAAAMYESVLGPLQGGANGDFADKAEKRLRLMDNLREDIGRLNKALASSEKQKLERYLAAVEAFEQRQEMLAGLSCNADPAGLPGPNGHQENMAAMTDLLALSMACGLTAVATVQIAAGDQHVNSEYGPAAVGTIFEEYGHHGAISNHGHQDATNFPGMTGVQVRQLAQELRHRAECEMIANFLSILDLVGELDNTLVVLTSDNGHQHHNDQRSRCPVVLIGTWNGSLRCDGRYLRYPKLERSWADLFCTIGHAGGAPTDNFGDGGAEMVEGPIEELLTS